MQVYFETKNVYRKGKTAILLTHLEQLIHITKLIVFQYYDSDKRLSSINKHSFF